MNRQVGDVSVDVGDDFVAMVEIHRAPNNFFDLELVRTLADIYAELDDDDGCRAVVLCAEGKHFCAGANFGPGPTSGRSDQARPAGDTPAGRPAGATAVSNELYAEAVRLFEAQTPVVAAVQGAAVGGGLGLACSADFRVGCPGTRMTANFARLGFHQGFGLSVTLPAIIGMQRATELLYTGRRIDGEQALAMGLCDRLVASDDVRSEARALAAELAASAPLAVRSIRNTMRGDLAARVKAATDHENGEQDWLRRTEDWSEGVRASAERRTPEFKGR